MSIQPKIPVVMRQTITQYTDIRDELEDFLDFIQDICCGIGGTIDEIDDQLDTLCDRLTTYNEIAEKYIFLSDCLAPKQPSPVPSPSEEEELPFLPADSKEAI